MCIESRDWRREEVKKQRRQQSQRPDTGLTVNEFLASTRPACKQAIQSRGSKKKPVFFIMLFLTILVASGFFLLYEILPLVP